MTARLRKDGKACNWKGAKPARMIWLTQAGWRLVNGVNPDGTYPARERLLATLERMRQEGKGIS